MRTSAGTGSGGRASQAGQPGRGGTRVPARAGSAGRKRLSAQSNITVGDDQAGRPRQRVAQLRCCCRCRRHCCCHCRCPHRAACRLQPPHRTSSLPQALPLSGSTNGSHSFSSTCRGGGGGEYICVPRGRGRDAVKPSRGARLGGACHGSSSCRRSRGRSSRTQKGAVTRRAWQDCAWRRAAPRLQSTTTLLSAAGGGAALAGASPPPG